MPLTVFSASQRSTPTEFMHQQELKISQMFVQKHMAVNRA